jgi:hypothetical protein
MKKAAKKKTAKKKKGNSGLSAITAHAKKIWKKGKEKWTDAISRASKELKKAGK